MPARYFARKVGFYLIALWGALTLNFFLPRLIPGNPVEALLARMSQTGSPPPGEYKALQALLGVGGSNIGSQYLHYLSQLAHLNLGVSITDFPVPVTTIIASALPWTIVLVGTATVLAFLVGTALGALAGSKRSKWLDSVIPTTTFLTAMPYFWLALLLLYLFAVVLRALPLNGGYAPTLTIGWSGSFIASAASHAILPAATIVLAQIGGWLLSMRNMTLTTLSEDYVLAAEAKGLSPRRVLIRYAARNAVLPSFTGFAISLGFVVSGSIIMEIVFSYPGIGYELLEAVQNNDYALMQGIFLVITMAVLAANFIVDMLYVFIDPRIRQAS
ncbi:MAG: ABC transporter permease [Solirubrobacteraceae bacterium]